MAYQHELCHHYCNVYEPYTPPLTSVNMLPLAFLQHIPITNHINEAKPRRLGIFTHKLMMKKMTANPAKIPNASFLLLETRLTT